MPNKSKSPVQTSKVPGTLARSELNLPTTITRIPIGDLKLDPRNPRVHSERQIEQLAKSIKSFGFLWPVMIDGKRRRPHRLDLVSRKDSGQAVIVQLGATETVTIRGFERLVTTAVTHAYDVVDRVGRSADHLRHGSQSVRHF
ncbi:MAG: ParB/RepB/Spo0J family partition protein [Candidatus Sulfotelmatobacter sp.]